MIPKPARSDETAALLEALRQAGYDQTAHEAALASIKKQPNSVSLRDAIDHANWANPGGEPIGLGARDEYLHTLPRDQARAVVAVQDALAKAPLGRQLMNQARMGGVEFGFGEMPAHVIAKYGVRQRQNLFNSGRRLPEEAASFVNRMGYVTAHELTHTQQHANLGPRFAEWENGVDNLAIRLDDRILLDRHMEATASAASIQVAFDAMAAGHNGMWRDIADHRTDINELQAFVAVIGQDKSSGQDGRARRAAHDAFFSDGQYIGVYDDSRIKAYGRVLHLLAKQQAEGFPDKDAEALSKIIGSRRLGDDDIATAALMPDGINHMTLPGTDGVRAERYTQPTSERAQGQTQYLMAMADRFRAGLRVAPVMVEAVQTIANPAEAEKALRDLALVDSVEGVLNGDPATPANEPAATSGGLILPPGVKLGG